MTKIKFEQNSIMYSMMNLILRHESPVSINPIFQKSAILEITNKLTAWIICLVYTKFTIQKAGKNFVYVMLYFSIVKIQFKCLNFNDGKNLENRYLNIDKIKWIDQFNFECNQFHFWFRWLTSLEAMSSRMSFQINAHLSYILLPTWGMDVNLLWNPYKLIQIEITHVQITGMKCRFKIRWTHH